MNQIYAFFFSQRIRLKNYKIYISDENTFFHLKIRRFWSD